MVATMVRIIVDVRNAYYSDLTGHSSHSSGLSNIASCFHFDKETFKLSVMKTGVA